MVAVLLGFLVAVLMGLVTIFLALVVTVFLGLSKICKNYIKSISVRHLVSFFKFLAPTHLVI